MSLSKSVPEGLNPREWKQTKLRKPPPVPYIPKKDKVQEEVAKLCQLQIKTSLEEDTTLNFALWQDNGTREAFLMHVMAVLDAMKKRGHFSNYDKVQKVHKEAAKAAELAEAGLALHKGTLEKSSKCKLKKLTKAKEAAKEALSKAQETKPETKEAVEASASTEYSIKAGFQVDLEKAMQAQETAQGAMTTAATLMLRSSQICFLPRASTRGTRLSSSRRKAAHVSTFKVSHWKAQGERLASHLTIA